MPGGQKKLTGLKHRDGFTLVELLIVIGLLTVFAAVMWPDSETADEARLELAASEVAAALRLARSEAMRTGESHGVWASTLLQRLRVYHLNTEELLPFYEFNVRHPVDKKVMDLKFDTSPELNEVELSQVSFAFNGLPSSEFLGFDRHGNPQYNDGVLIYPLASATLGIAYRGHVRTITVQPGSGRVVVGP